MHRGIFVLGSATRRVCKLCRDADAVQGPGRRCEVGRWGTGTFPLRFPKRAWRRRAGRDACRRGGSVGSGSWPDSRLPGGRHSGAYQLFGLVRLWPGRASSARAGRDRPADHTSACVAGRSPLGLGFVGEGRCARTVTPGPESPPPSAQWCSSPLFCSRQSCRSSA